MVYHLIVSLITAVAVIIGWAVALTCDISDSANIRPWNWVVLFI